MVGGGVPLYLKFRVKMTLKNGDLSVTYFQVFHFKWLVCFYTLIDGYFHVHFSVLMPVFCFRLIGDMDSLYLV